MKKSSKFLHSLLHSAVRFPAKFSSPPVVPWPLLHQSSFDGWFSGELDALISSPNSSTTTSTRWLLCAFDLALAAQKTAIKSIMTTTNNNIENIIDREIIIEDHLEEVIDLLDMCNSLREMIENVKNYIVLLRIMLHWLEGNNSPNKTGLARAHDMLSSCEETERKFSEIVKCRSISFGKKQGRAVHETVICEETELYEALNGSKAITFLACGALNQSLSFKSKRGGVGLRKMKSFGKTSTSCWSVLFQELREEVEKGGKFSELRDTVMAVKQLRNLVSKVPSEIKDEDYWEKELRVGVEGLRRRCEGIEGEIVKPLEGKMDELYRDLISVRLGLLGILSKTQKGLN